MDFLVHVVNTIRYQENSGPKLSVTYFFVQNYKLFLAFFICIVFCMYLDIRMLRYIVKLCIQKSK
jgi:hypothetical protein